MSKSGTTKHLGGGTASLRSLIPEFNVVFGPLSMALHLLQDAPHARNHTNSITARVSMSSKIIGTVGLKDAASIVKKSSRAEKVFPMPQKSSSDSQADLLSVSSNGLSVTGSQPYILPPLHAGTGASVESLPSSYRVKVSDNPQPKRSTIESNEGVVDLQKKKRLKWAIALDDSMQDDSISIITMDESVELKSSSRRSSLSRDQPRSSSNNKTNTYFPELPSSSNHSTSPSSNGARSQSISPLRFDDGESPTANRKQQRPKQGHTSRSKASSLSSGEDRHNKDTDSMSYDPTAIVTHRQVRPEQAEELPANEQKALQVIMDVRKCQRKGKKFENRPLSKVEVNLLQR